MLIRRRRFLWGFHDCGNVVSCDCLLLFAALTVVCLSHVFYVSVSGGEGKNTPNNSSPHAAAAREELLRGVAVGISAAAGCVSLLFFFMLLLLFLVQ